MIYLFLLAVALIAYGSLYPFHFRADGLPFRALVEAGWSSRGDLLGNFALFLPFGYLGMVAWRRPARPLRFVLLVALAAIYGALLQVVQLHVPERDPSLRDVLPNALGAALGGLAGAMPFLDVRRLANREGARATPWILIGFWLAYRLAPFVPSLDWQEWKDSLKPLRDWSRLEWSAVVHGAAAWLAVGCLGRHRGSSSRHANIQPAGCHSTHQRASEHPSRAMNPDVVVGAALRAATGAAAPPARLGVGWLPALVAATFGLEVLIVDNAVTPANVLSALLGLSLFALIAGLRSRCAVASLILAAAIILDGLRPFEVSATRTAFEWVPFGGFLQGSMLVNAMSLFEKVFFYGALVWLVREAGLRLAVAAGAAAVLLLGIEVAQTMLPGRKPEITDPLLALLAGWFFRVGDSRREPSVVGEEPAATLTARGPAR